MAENSGAHGLKAAKDAAAAHCTPGSGAAEKKDPEEAAPLTAKRTTRIRTRTTMGNQRTTLASERGGGGSQ